MYFCKLILPDQEESESKSEPFLPLTKTENFDDLVPFPLDYVADSPRDSVQFIEWSPAACPRALLIANFHGRITIWTNPTLVSCHRSILFFNT